MTAIPEGSVVVTPTEIYAKVLTLTDVVTELLARDKADQQRRVDQKEADARRETEAAKRDADTKAQVTAVELRLGAVEKKLYLAAGFAAAVGGALGRYLPSLGGGSP